MVTTELDHELLRQSLRRFVAEEVVPAEAGAEEAGRLPSHLWRRLAELDLTGLLVPRAFGGSGGDVASATVVAEELARGSASLAWTWLEHTDAAWILDGCGTEVAKERYLPLLASGELTGSALKSTEAGGGTNTGAIAATASATEAGYLLNGRKVFQGLAGTADLYLVVARMEPPPEPGPFGVFLVPRESPGISFGVRERTIGLRALSVGEILLERCPVPAENLVGAPGGLGAVFGHHGRLAALLVAAIAVGLAEATVLETVAFLSGREVAGECLAHLPVVQLRFADVLVELESARGLLERATSGKGHPTLGILAKVSASEGAARVIDRCLQLHGSAGYAAGLPIERRARDVRALTLHYGTNDQLRLAAARARFTAR